MKRAITVEIIFVLLAGLCVISISSARTTYAKTISVLKNFDYTKTVPEKNVKRGVELFAAEKERQRILEEQRKIAELQDNIIKACEEQAVWAKNAIYDWEGAPTIEKSKKRGTCVTYVACVLQRLGYLSSGRFVWHNGSGYGTGKVSGVTNQMSLEYKGNVPISSLRGQLQKGDIILVDDNKSGESGSGGHVFIFAGEWNGDSPYIYDNFSNKQGKHTYGKNRKVLAVVRLNP